MKNTFILSSQIDNFPNLRKRHPRQSFTFFSEKSMIIILISQKKITFSEHHLSTLKTFYALKPTKQHFNTFSSYEKRACNPGDLLKANFFKKKTSYTNRQNLFFVTKSSYSETTFSISLLKNHVGSSTILIIISFFSNTNI